jgi:hypothetical protein
VVAALVIVAGTVALVLAEGGGAGSVPAGRATALLAGGPAKAVAAADETEKTVLGCVRGATASALSAAVPAAPLAATGVLIPGSAALIATASAIGCGVGAVSTTATSVAGWVMRRAREVSAAWGG